MTQKMTRDGARQLTASIDRIANTIQQYAGVLGIDPRIAKDYAYRCDLISDAVEQRAVLNYPKQAEAAADEIGAETKGPIYEEQADPDLKGQFTQAEFSELTEMEDKSALGNAANSKVLASFDEMLTNAERTLEAGPRSVRGYKGLMDQVRTLKAIEAEVAELDAQIQASVGELVKKKKELSGDQKKIYGEINKQYKENLEVVGDVIIETTSKTTKAAAMLKVASRKGSMNAAWEDVIEAIVAEYEDVNADFIRQTMESIREAKSKLAVTFKGVDLVERSELDGTGKTAGLADMLTRFQAYISKAWRGLVDFIRNVGKVAKAQGQKVDKVHSRLEKALSDAAKDSRVATEAPSDDVFNLFA